MKIEIVSIIVLFVFFAGLTLARYAQKKGWLDDGFADFGHKDTDCDDFWSSNDCGDDGD